MSWGVGWGGVGLIACLVASERFFFFIFILFQEGLVSFMVMKNGWSRVVGRETNSQALEDFHWGFLSQKMQNKVEGYDLESTDEESGFPVDVQKAQTSQTSEEMFKMVRELCKMLKKNQRCTCN